MDFNKSVIERSKTTPVVVQYSANWCGPCRVMKPMITQQALSRQDFEYIVVDVDVEKEIAKSFGIRSIPTVMLFKNGSNVGTFRSGPSPQAFTNWLNQFIQKKEAEKSAS